MTKTLLLMRHAKSSWADPDQPDAERPLTARGKREAERMGQELYRRGLAPAQILCSTAKRARSTANRVVEAAPPDAEPPVVLDSRLYASDAAAYRRVLADEAQGDTVLLIGHNPTLEELASAMVGQTMVLSTANVVVVSLDLANWCDLNGQTHGLLLALLAPRDLAIVPLEED
ncbi:MAG: histidine phosphatase family protein [Anaerolineales bacterium]